MGAVFDPKTYESTLRIGNLHQLEVLTHKLQPPKWPAEVLGAIDEAKAQQGEQIFNQKCADCHQDKMFAQIQIGTDPNRANSFGQPVGKTPFPKAVAPILDGLKKRAFADDGISPADQAKMDAGSGNLARHGAVSGAAFEGYLGDRSLLAQRFGAHTVRVAASRTASCEVRRGKPRVRPGKDRVPERPAVTGRTCGCTTRPNPATAISGIAAMPSARRCPKTRNPHCSNI